MEPEIFSVKMDPSDFDDEDLDGIFHTVCGLPLTRPIGEHEWFDLEVHIPSEAQWIPGDKFYAHVTAHVFEQ